jgi:hypothetical protein
MRLGRWTRPTVIVYCFAMFVRRRRIYHLSYHLGETADCGARTDDCVFPLLSMAEETTPAKQLAYYS